ncbi:lytic transglycosylase domain-containing protein [Alphaproteobacteria bacterium]|nr:lytic transglycosylase domain-containing protein [Alphaproteobacteria bacterium]
MTAIAGVFLTSLAPAFAAPIVPVPRPNYQPADKVPDTVLYEEIFLQQEQANWKQADRLIKKLDDDILMGHILFQRYMHPTAYRSNWSEMRDWLQQYADHPSAWQVYKLAEKRRPRGAAKAKSPPARVYFGNSTSSASPLFKTYTSRKIKNEVYALVRRERPTQALRFITQKPQSSRLTEYESDFLKSLIARSYYIEGKVEEALKLAREAARSRRHAQLSDWHVGLAAYRLGQMDLAITHFEHLAVNPTASNELRARASYWAARVLRSQGKIVEAEQHFMAAAASGAHFYGLLAMQHVTNDLLIEWHRADDATGNLFANHPALRRAQLLRDVGQPELAELELLYLQERLNEAEARTLLSYARENDYPAAQLALANRLGTQLGTGLPISLYESSYPLLPTTKDLTLDRALLLALIRQESRFKSFAKSHAGARGLMQIMPQTAAFISGDRSFSKRLGRDQLLDAQTNLGLGQKYLTMLLSKKYFENNLILALAGYNGGPGNVRRWHRELANVDDPLLFIESLPAPETLGYIHKVMTNLWIYRNRLGQDASSQRILSAESWPLYAPLDEPTTLASQLPLAPKSLDN